MYGHICMHLKYSGIMYSVLDVLNVGCIVGIQVEMTNKTFGCSGLEIKEKLGYRGYLKPWPGKTVI